MRWSNGTRPRSLWPPSSGSPRGCACTPHRVREPPTRAPRSTRAIGSLPARRHATRADTGRKRESASRRQRARSRRPSPGMGGSVRSRTGTSPAGKPTPAQSGRDHGQGRREEPRQTERRNDWGSRAIRHLDPGQGWGADAIRTRLLCNAGRRRRCFESLSQWVLKENGFTWRPRGRRRPAPSHTRRVWVVDEQARPVQPQVECPARAADAPLRILDPTTPSA